MPDDLPDPVRRFIAEHIRSIAQLELLLLLSQQPGRSWTVEGAAKALYTAVSMTGPMLESLREIGLLSLKADQYAYEPQTNEQGELVAQLAKLYQERRVTIVNLIYSAPVDKLQSFADAFRIRKPPEEN